MTKIESLIICCLRLYYHEQMRSAAEEERCDISVGMLRERLVHAGKPPAKLSANVLAPSLRKLMRHSLVQIERGFEAQDHEIVVVSPLIEKVLPTDRIQEIEEKLKTYAGSRSSTSGATDEGEIEVDAPEDEPEESSA